MIFLPANPKNDLLTAHEPRHAENSMECAGKAQRRRRFGVGHAFRSRNQSGVALRLPPHSVESSVLGRAERSEEPIPVGAAAQQHRPAERQGMKPFAAALWILGVLLLSACQHTYRELPVGGAPPRPELPTGSTVYVAIPPDGRHRKEFVPESGQFTAVTLRDAFAKYVKRAYVGRRVQSYQEGLETARAAGCGYFVYPTILRWEDRFTEYSGRRDLVEIKVEIAEAASGEVLHATILRGRSRLFTDGGDTPQDLLPEPIRNYVASLFQPVHVPSALR
jgi:hypothetical protein